MVPETSRYVGVLRTVSNGRKPDGVIGRLLRNVRSIFIGRTVIRGAAPDRVAAIEASATTGAIGTAGKAGNAAIVEPAPAPSASVLITEGLRQRQQVGTAAARPYFEGAAKLEPNSHVPWFMLGNVASELGELDTPSPTTSTPGI